MWRVRPAAHNSMLHTTPRTSANRDESSHHTTPHGTRHRMARLRGSGLPRTAPAHDSRHRTAQRWRGHVSRSGGLMYRTVSPHGLSRVLIRMPPSRDRALIRWDPHPSPRPSTFAQPQRPSSRSSACPARSSSCLPSRTPQRPTSRSRLCATSHLTPPYALLGSPIGIRVVESASEPSGHPDF